MNEYKTHDTGFVAVLMTLGKAIKDTELENGVVSFYFDYDEDIVSLEKRYMLKNLPVDGKTLIENFQYAKSLIYKEIDK